MLDLKLALSLIVITYTAIVGIRSMIQGRFMDVRGARARIAGLILVVVGIVLLVGYEIAIAIRWGASARLNNQYFTDVFIAAIALPVVSWIIAGGIAYVALVRPSNLLNMAMHRLFRRRSSIIGLVILCLLILTAICAPLIVPYHPNIPLSGKERATVKNREAPCVHLLGCAADKPEHLMGMDGVVRDEFSRIIYGTRTSLFVGFAAVTFAIVVGTLLGAISGYAGGWLDIGIMRVMDVLLAFPSLLLAIAIVSVLGRDLLNALIAIGIVSVPIYARVTRASVLSVKEQDFVEASNALGASHFQVLFWRVLPNSLTPLIVTGTLGIATAILDAAALSFIGLGAQEPMPEWGLMLSTERSQVFSAPHLVFFPGLAIMITVLAFNLLGDGLRDALDPRLAKSDIGAEG